MKMIQIIKLWLLCGVFLCGICKSETVQTVKLDLEAIERMILEQSSLLDRTKSHLQTVYGLDPLKNYSVDLDNGMIHALTKDGNPEPGLSRNLSAQKLELVVKMLTVKRLGEVKLSALKMLRYDKTRRFEALRDGSAESKAGHDGSPLVGEGAR